MRIVVVGATEEGAARVAAFLRRQGHDAVTATFDTDLDSLAGDTPAVAEHTGRRSGTA